MERKERCSSGGVPNNDLFLEVNPTASVNHKLSLQPLLVPDARAGQAVLIPPQIRAALSEPACLQHF